MARELSKAELDAHLTNFLPRAAGRTTASLGYNQVRVRPEFNHKDAHGLRANIDIPDDIYQLMRVCGDIYHKSSVFRSVVECMSQYTIEGVELYSKDPKVNEFYQEWFKKARMDDRCYQFAKHLYKYCNVIVRRYINKATINNLETDTTKAENWNEYPKKRIKEIPTRYYFYQPYNVELIGGEAGAFSTTKMYGLRVNREDWFRLQQANTDLEKEVLEGLPKDVIDALKNTNTTYVNIPLNNRNIYVAHFDKEDSEVWATPIVTPAIPDIQFNINVKLAKNAGLEGFYNPLRLWKLGDHVNGVLPSQKVANTLADLLENNNNSGPLDIIWDSMISLEVFYPPLEKLIDIDENNDNILITYGFPQEVIGGKTTSSTQSNPSALRLKNVISKIKMARREILEWLNFEIDIIHKNMGFKNNSKPKVIFKRPDLDDNSVIFDFLIDLLDRNVISDQRILEIMGENSEFEAYKIGKETTLRESDKKPLKAGPYHNPDLLIQQEHEMEKLNSANLAKQDNSLNTNGRPKGAKDTRPRKSKAELLLTASKNYKAVSNLLTAKFLEMLEVKDFRKLTNDQKEQISNAIDWAVVSQDPGQDINLADLGNLDPVKINKFQKIYGELLNESNSENKTLDDKQMLKCLAYAEMYS